MTTAGTSVTAVGGLLPRDLLDRVTARDPGLPGMEATDFGLAPGERLNDAIARSWNRLRGLWESFRRAEAQLPDSDQTATALTRDRWLRPLLEELGFAGLPAAAKALEVDGKDYPISHQWGATVPVHLPGARVPIDRTSRGVPGAARTSPHGLVQEFLNRSDTHLWGVISNGLVLRILRDNASMTRQAYLEFDLEAMFDGEAFAEFAVLWLCCHRTRFEGDPAEKCLLEQWSAEAASAGTRALDRLRSGVEDAIVSLGEGFIAHPGNGELREALRSRELSSEELQRQILRVVYRLLFLLVSESRDLLLAPDATDQAKSRYRRYYSVERVRTLAARRRGTSHDDLWASLAVTMHALGSAGAPAIGLAPLGSLLFSPDAISGLVGASLDNRHLLEAIRNLCFVRDADAKVHRPVDYRNLGSEELGSIYEALLELHARIDVDARTFALDTAAGNERKTTGSYYTPTPLIRVLLDSALDPVLDEAERATDPEAALLALKVMDPACGSGHFLIAAAHRIAGRLASLRSGGAEPAPEDLRHALREVINHCLYAIDVNPMAVELCKVSLWMEATEPGRPLGFLDHRIVCGNSLLGATPALIEAGVPDEAFKPLEGDDKACATAFKKHNKEDRKHRAQGVLALDFGVAADAATLAAGLAAIEELGDATTAAIAEKEARFRALQSSDAALRAKLAADAWCAAFVAPKVKGAPLITDATVRLCLRSPENVPEDARRVIDELAVRYRFLHLHVAFPDVCRVPDSPVGAENALCGWNGGFDVVLGNPPWERVKLQEKEWFAVRDPEIATAPNAAARKRLIAKLMDEQPELHAEFLADSRRAEGESALLRNSGRYPLGGRGDVNTYAVFAELMRNAISTTGRVGVIVPTGIATDDTTKFFFADLVDRASLVSLYDFENRYKIFPGIDSRIKFSLLTLSGDARPIEAAEFVFFAMEVADLENPEKRFTLSPDDFVLLNPNTRTCPVFRTRRDAEITKAIYRRVPVLVREGDPDGNPWGVKFSTMFHMSNDSHLFRTREQLEVDGWALQGNHFVRGEDRYLPIYEGKMTNFFDHRDADIVINPANAVRPQQSLPIADQHLSPVRTAMPYLWVDVKEVNRRRLWPHRWSVGSKRVTASTNWRTMIGAVVPAAGCSYTLYLQDCLSAGEIHASVALVCVTNSHAFDFLVRQKTSQPSLPIGCIRESAVPRPEFVIRRFVPFLGHALELSYTAWDLEEFAADLGYHGPPFRWDEERRALLRAELDALMFRLYGIERDDIEYILDTFPIVKRRDEAKFGEYRTKRLILERFDAMAEAEAAGRPYETVLDPPPADPSLAHPESTRPTWAVRPPMRSDATGWTRRDRRRDLATD